MNSYPKLKVFRKEALVKCLALIVGSTLPLITSAQTLMAANLNQALKTGQQLILVASEPNNIVKTPDMMHFCYLNGQPYSEGAEASNLTCVRPHMINAYDTTELPLRWERKFSKT